MSFSHEEMMFGLCGSDVSCPMACHSEEEPHVWLDMPRVIQHLHSHVAEAEGPELVARAP